MTENSDLSIKGIVFDIQRYSIYDGPGIRTLIFLKGCPLTCIWCQNPEGQKRSIEIGYNPNKCIICRECVKICPTKSIDLDSKWAIDRKTCSLCGKCAEVCYSEAMVIFGKKLTVEEVIEEIEKDKPFYAETDGGITLSGGEPTMQLEFAQKILEESKKRGISTAIETSGYFKWTDFRTLLPFLDWVLFDLKIIDEKAHRKFCGQSNKIILQNARNLAEVFSNIIFRMPIIPGINNNERNVQLTCQLVKKQGKKEIYLIPYHKMGYMKYQMLGRHPQDTHIELVTDSSNAVIRTIVEREGLKPIVN